jgi:hypothetical protein
VVAALILILAKLKDVISSAAVGTVRFGWRPMLLLFLVGVWTGFIVLDCATYMLLVLVLIEPRRVCRRLVGLSYAAKAISCN